MKIQEMKKKKHNSKQLLNTRSMLDEFTRDKSVVANLAGYGDVQAQRRGWYIYEDE